MMKLYVLGCSGPFPCAGEATSGYLLQADGDFFLLDCGAGVLGKLTGLIDPAELKAVFLSHLHYDHMSDMGVLNYYLSTQNIKMPVYYPGDDTGPVSQLLAGMPSFAVQAYREEQSVASVQIRTCKTLHPVPNRALRFFYEGKSLVYTGDAAEKGALVQFSAHADLLLADAAFAHGNRPEKAPHMSASDAAELARDADVKKLVLTHFSPQARPELLCAEARTFFQNTEAAAPGMRFTV